MRYDLIVLGREACGLEAALHAAKLRKRVAVVECQPPLGEPTDLRNVSLSALREAVLLLTGFRHRHVTPELFSRRREITMQDLRRAAGDIADQRDAAIKTELSQHGVEFLSGQAQFIDPHAVSVIQPSNSAIILNADNILIAVGTRPHRPNTLPFDGETILDEEEIFALDQVPKSLIVIGDDTRTLEYATSLAVLGVRVAWICERKRFFAFCDDAVESVFRLQAERQGLRFRHGLKVQSIERSPDNRAAVTFNTGRRLLAERVLCVCARLGNTSSLNLHAAGLASDERGCLWCNEQSQTWAKHIYGAGSVVGFPNIDGLLKAGVRVIDHAFGVGRTINASPAYGISTIPELASVGATERQLRSNLVPYEIGIHRFRDSARGHVGGFPTGMLKLIFHRESQRLLGVHCLDESAREAIQIGQTVMALDDTLEALMEPSLKNSSIGDCYQAAAQDGLRRLRNSAASAYRMARSAWAHPRCFSVT